MLRKKNFIFTNKRHPVRGIMSSVLGVIACADMAAAIYFTFRNQGVSPLRYGAVGLLSTLFSATGLVFGILSFMEQDSYHLFSYVGVVLNFLMLAAIGCILYLGVG